MFRLLATVTLCSVLFGQSPSLASLNDDSVDKEAYEQRLAALSQQLSEARKNADEKARSLLSRTNEKDQAKLDLDRISSVTQIKKTSLGSLQNANASIATEIAENKKRIIAQEGAATTLSAQINSLVAKEKQAGEDQRSAADDADLATKAVNTQNANLADIQKEITDNQTQISRNDTLIAENETQLATSQSELTDLEEQERQLLAEKSDIQQQQKDLRNDMDDIDRAFRSLQKQIADNDLIVQKASDALQMKDESIAGIERTLEEQKRKLADANDKLGKETQKSAAIAKAIEELRKKQSTENTNLKAIDIENESLTESITQSNAEIASIDSQLENVKTQIAEVQSKLKDATDKGPLEERLMELKAKQTELAASLKTQRDLLAKDKAARTALIGKKAEVKLRLVDIDNQAAQKADEQTAIAQVIGAAAKEEQAAKVALDASSRSLDKAKTDLVAAKAEAERLYSIQDKLDERWQELDGFQDLLAKKGPFLSTVLISLNASLRIVQDEALPKVQSAETTAKQLLADLTATHQQLLAEGRKLQREKTDNTTSLAEYQRQSGLRAAELKAAERIVTETRNSLLVARQTLAGINAEVASLRTSIADRDALIAKNQIAIKVAIDEISKLDGQIVAQTKVLNDAQLAEKWARDIWEPLEQAAVAAAKATDEAKTLLASRIAAYQKALADVVQKAAKDAQGPGATEGLSGGAPGSIAGALAGEISWKQEGSSQLRAAEFAKAFDVARAQAVSANVIADIRENSAQQAERIANVSLQASFDAGIKRGKADGMKSGILLGDTAEAEKRGYDAGYAVGKRRVESEMEQALRKVNYQQREAEILKDDPPVIPPTREKRDATKEQAAYFGVSHLLRLFQVTEAVAADGLGVIPASQVPKVTYSGRKYLDSGLKPFHADFAGVYRAAYDEAYSKAYTASYLDSYRTQFVKAHGDAFAAAKAKSLQDGFADEVKKGTEAGTKDGLFEALGYNAGRDAGLIEGKKKGELTALERGKSAGDAQGYKDNQEPARLAAIANGRADCDSVYRNSVRLVAKTPNLSLVEEVANKRIELNEKLSWGGTLRNFGGTRAEKATVTIQVDAASIRGVKFDKNTITLAAVEANSEVEFSNLLTGVVTPDSQVAFKAGVFYDSKKVAEFAFTQEIYAPFLVSFSDYYYATKSMRVGDVGRGNGYLNAVRVKSLGDAKLLDDLKVAISLADASVGKTSWYQTTGEFVALDEKATDGTRFKGFFLNAAASAGLAKNKIRVRLQNKLGQIVFDKIVDAPVEVRQ